jgi:hypothetical protein
MEAIVSPCLCKIGRTPISRMLQCVDMVISVAPASRRLLLSHNFKTAGKMQALPNSKD